MELISLDSQPPARFQAPEGGVGLYVAGLGSVGAALLRQLDALPSTPLRLVGACTTRGAVWMPDEPLPTPALDRLRWDEPTSWERILERLERPRARPLVFVDATGSPDVARCYPRLLRAGVHVVTPSKHANTFEQAYFDTLVRLADECHVHYRFETTVGAGLPVIQVIQDLRATGDRVREVCGCASGTLTFLFSALSRGVPFSRAVQLAAEHGYTEPDVRDDLSGEDVARKFIILARTAGYAVERSEVGVESLVPESLRALPRDCVLSALAQYDALWQQRTEAARASGQVLRYVGRLSASRIAVGVRTVPLESSLGQLDGTDNLFEIYTDRYDRSPISVRGPGAGPELTAAGVLTDVLKATSGCSSLGARGSTRRV